MRTLQLCAAALALAACADDSAGTSSTTDACTYGTITCDGPEDCASGENCCAHWNGDGWALACQSGGCGAPPANEELCHDTTTCDGGGCVSAYGVNNDLPRTLSICR